VTQAVKREFVLAFRAALSIALAVFVGPNGMRFS
jgi:hypothetical protein